MKRAKGICGNMHYDNPRRREKGVERLFEENMAENFPNLRSLMILGRIHSKWFTPRQTVKVKNKDS